MKEIEYYKKKDYKKLGGLLALAYGAYIPSLYISQQATSISDYAVQFGIISGVFLSLRLPYIKQVPLALTRLFAKLTMARKTSTPSQNILDDIEELRLNAGIKSPIKTKIVEKGWALHNAYTFGNEIYVGKELLKQMNRDELKSIMAHEMAHIRTKDISERYLTWPPFVDSILVAITGAAGLIDTIFSQNTALMPAAALTAALSYAYYKYQKALHNGFSRVIEYRADRHGVKLTGDFKSAASSMIKLDHGCLTKFPPLKQIFKSHPIGIDRLRNIEKSGTEDQSSKCIDFIYETRHKTTDLGFIMKLYRDPKSVIDSVYEAIYEKKIPPSKIELKLEAMRTNPT